ncbi:MAG TPA: hypothetical protein H9950_06105 [Candidatus Bacteroides avicola]|uniref:Uncharacterized protein n=1 Tax=Candidatus Bacteroides avicola TaxID=2838468 RepID=A0A9D2HWN0_9BACE|nr:hypothetical protein [Mediterranea sp. An20]HJA85751.1 hypothetical protein [Candidatus Bacteroides avicola]
MWQVRACFFPFPGRKCIRLGHVCTMVAEGAGFSPGHLLPVGMKVRFSLIL